MTHRQLPDRPHHDQLKQQAKDFLARVRAGDPGSVDELREHHPEALSPSDVRLADAQLAMARAYGFASWARLVHHVRGVVLRQAIWDRDTQTVDRIVAEDPSAASEAGPHPRWGGDPTALHVAAERGDAAVVRRLLEAGADPDGGDSDYGWTPLQLSAHWNHGEAAAVLRQHGARVDVFAAALLGDDDTLRAMLKERPTLASTPGLNGASPLHVATTAATAALLLEHGAPIDEVDRMGNTPVDSALGRGDRCLPVVFLLVQRGSPASVQQLAALGLIDRLAEAVETDPACLASVRNIGVNAVAGTPLHAAAHHGRCDVVAWLLQRGADPNARANAGQTPLHLSRDQATAAALIAGGADPTATDGEHHTTPLVWARLAAQHWRANDPDAKALAAYLETVTPEGDDNNS